jgi:hypothetical protein
MQGVLPIEYLLAAPLEALVRAQAMAARTTADFVGEVGFDVDKDGVSRARMLDFEYVHPQSDPDQPGNRVDTPVRVRVPVLSLLAIPNVMVDEATIELQVRVVGTQEARVGSLPLPMPENRIRMMGSYASPKLAEQSASLKVSIKLKQAPPPEGLSQLLSLLGEATTARPIQEG